MKTISTLLFAFFVLISTNAQNVIGQWNGILKVEETQLRLVFNISQPNGQLLATMDSPDQGAKGIAVTAVSFDNSVLKLAIANARIEFEGTLANDGIIKGIFKQGGQSFPMTLSKEKIEKQQIIRPQEPLKPYSYYHEEITFQNPKAGIMLAGTLTMPQKEGVFPAVILISGSGPQNRDEEILGHKPFLVLSDYFTKNGFAVLRYDDRGTALSKGDFKSSTTADFATDVEAAIAFLKTRKEINYKKIGLIGHSEGGIIAPMVASKSKDVAFIVLLAGSGVDGGDILLMQQKLIGTAAGASEIDLQKNENLHKKAFEIVKKSKDLEQAKADLTTHIAEFQKNNSSSDKPTGMSDDDFVKLQVKRIANPWMQFFIKYNPALALEKVKCPVLAINGEKDLQVLPKQNLVAIKTALTKGGNKNVTIKELPKLNHLFQECKTGAPTEYAAIEETFSTKAMTEILNWLQQQTK